MQNLFHTLKHVIIVVLLCFNLFTGCSQQAEPAANPPQDKTPESPAPASETPVESAPSTAASREPATTETPLPNIVVVLIDTLRANYLDAYGYPEKTAPFINTIAGQSSTFTRAFSTSSWTAPSTASIFTGVYPDKHELIWGFAAQRSQIDKSLPQEERKMQIDKINPALPTLPEYLSALGYQTHAYASNPNIGPEMQFNRGFDHFIRKSRQNASVFIRDIIAKQEILQEQPYLLYLHLNDCHTPYTRRKAFYRTPENFNDKTEREKAKYLSEIGYVDNQIKKLYKSLQLEENTIFILLSDHGEEFMDHGQLFHKGTLYDELNRIICTFKGPGITPQRLDYNVSGVDIIPTLLELLGQPIPEHMEGQSLVPLLRDEADASPLADTLEERTLFAHRMDNHNPGQEYWAAIQQHWKLIESNAHGPKLFDHRSDEAEQSNIYAEKLTEIAALQDQLQTFKALFTKKKDTPKEKVEVPIDDALVEELESLGYLE